MAVLRCAVNTLKTRRQGFDYNFHHRVNSGAGGLYAFWLNAGACLYVGQSRDLSRRLYQHRMSEHNSDLEEYFRAFSQQIEVSYFSLPNPGEVELKRLEDRLIETLRPITNK